MTNTIAKRIGLPPRVINKPSSELIDSGRNIGVELEIENVRPRDAFADLGHLWKVERDDSLRPRDRSVELKSPSPGYSGEQLVQSLEALAGKDSLAHGTFGWRAGSHIHVDCRDKTPEDLAYIGPFYALLEPSIFAWDGSGRHESRFCMPWWVCSHDIATAFDIIHARNDNEFVGKISSFSKYTALNMEPLQRFGTLEFRHAKSSIDKAFLLEYINIGLDVVAAADKFRDTMSPMGMVLDYMSIGPERFISKWCDPVVSRALLRTPHEANIMPLIPKVFDRAISTAMTLAELQSHVRTIVPESIDMKVLLQF